MCWKLIEYHFNTGVPKETTGLQKTLPSMRDIGVVGLLSARWDISFKLTSGISKLHKSVVLQGVSYSYKIIYHFVEVFVGDVVHAQTKLIETNTRVRKALTGLFVKIENLIA